MKKKLIWFLMAFIVMGLATSYHSDIPLEELKERYTYSDSEFWNHEGMPIHYRVSGNGKQTIVLLHGTASSLHTWESWTNNLRKNYRVVSMDLPGFGLTGPEPNNNYKPERYVQFVDDVLNEIGVDSCIIAGNSFGGYVAWNYAVTHPDKVTKLGLLNSSGYPRDEESSFDFGFWMSSQGWAQPFVQRFTPRPLIAKSVRNVYFDEDKITELKVDRYFHMLLRTGNRAGLYGRLTQVRNTNSADIKKVQCPTLIMWGDHDNLVRVEDAGRFHVDIENSELLIYENMGHIPMEEIPQRSCRDFRAFIEK
ncbi:MAG: pimeloyl-ACP methyl ester carboxylesterase [Oceanospirillaceae bacterium]